VGKPEGKRLHDRPRCRWEDNIKMDLQEVGCGGMDWIELAQERNVYLPSLMVKVPDHLYVLGETYTCHT
jgi:hypothetical protein